VGREAGFSAAAASAPPSVEMTEFWVGRERTSKGKLQQQRQKQLQLRLRLQPQRQLQLRLRLQRQKQMRGFFAALRMTSVLHE
jgi:hypothetical protein